MTEEWRQIPGYEGIYDASSLGRIRSAPGKTTANARYDKRVWKVRVLKPKHPVSAKRRDLRVTLWKGGIRKDLLVSRLVAAAFYGTPKDGMTVNHKNGDYLDNRAENLEWVTMQENIKHGFDSGLYDSIATPVVLSCHGGEKVACRSLAAAARVLGRGDGYVSQRVRRGKFDAVGIDGKIYSVQMGV